jgi:hypothetical protein
MIVASVWYLCVCAPRYKLNYINAFFTITSFCVLVKAIGVHTSYEMNQSVPRGARASVTGHVWRGGSLQ